MFSYANRSDLVQKYSRFILDKFYGNGGDGLPGNDDYGTMSAWLAFASLGLYPLPSTERYILGSPLIHAARIVRKMPGSQIKILYINVNGNSAKKYKVNSVNLNGEVITELIHSQLKNNSLLNFDMSGMDDGDTF
jgi:putative alpha-1,2-mannosidase